MARAAGGGIKMPSSTTPEIPAKCQSSSQNTRNCWGDFVSMQYPLQRLALVDTLITLSAPNLRSRRHDSQRAADAHHRWTAPRQHAADAI